MCASVRVRGHIPATTSPVGQAGPVSGHTRAASGPSAFPRGEERAPSTSSLPVTFRRGAKRLTPFLIEINPRRLSYDTSTRPSPPKSKMPKRQAGQCARRARQCARHAAHASARDLSHAKGGDGSKPSRVKEEPTPPLAARSADRSSTVETAIVNATVESARLPRCRGPSARLPTWWRDNQSRAKALEPITLTWCGCGRVRPAPPSAPGGVRIRTLPVRVYVGGLQCATAGNPVVVACVCRGSGGPCGLEPPSSGP